MELQFTKENKFYEILNGEANKYVQYLYSRGFIFSREKLKMVKDTWKQEYISGYFIQYSPENVVCMRRGDDFDILVMGMLLDTENLTMDIDFITDRLYERLKVSEKVMWDYCDILGGRFIIFYRIGLQSYIMQDATGMRSVFYDINSGALSSHYNLIAQNYESTPNSFIKTYVEYKETPWLLPGDTTPYENIFCLAPNHTICLETLEVRRFWPREKIHDVSPKFVYDYIAKTIADEVAVLSRYYKLMMSLTKGNDSRITLSATRNVSTDLLYFTTYKTGTDQEEDNSYAINLCKRLKLKHSH